MFWFNRADDETSNNFRDRQQVSASCLAFRLQLQPNTIPSSVRETTTNKQQSISRPITFFPLEYVCGLEFRLHQCK
jgi:hypothetical protein